MIRLTDEEILAESKAYQKESQEIWDSDKPRQEKAELSMDLQDVYTRIAKAQLKKFREWLKSEVLEDCHEGYSNVMCFHKKALRELEDDCKA